jgi:hypothetical protein
LGAQVNTLHRLERGEASALDAIDTLLARNSYCARSAALRGALRALTMAFGCFSISPVVS